MGNPGIFNDFSGGITDFSLPGKPGSFKTLDNVVVLSDKQAEQRPGFNILAAGLGQLPTGYQRVAQLSSWDKGTRYAAFTEKRAYHVTAGVWTHLLGPTGSPAFNSNTVSSNVQTAEWQGHLFGATDSGDRVIKMYYDDTSTLRLRTAGLPEISEALLFPLDGGLANAIALANDILTQMVAHTGDDSASAALPKAEAHVTHATLTAQNAALAALTPATNLAELLTNLDAMRVVYQEHVVDAMKTDFQRAYHIKSGLNTWTVAVGTSPSMFVQPILNFNAIDPDATIPGSYTIAQAVPYLNDLRDKWNYHTYALWTHGNAMEQAGAAIFTGAGQYKTAVAQVKTYTWANISPNHGSYIKYVNDLVAEYRSHQSGSSRHTQADSYYDIPTQWHNSGTPPTTIQEATIALGALAFYFTGHDNDSSKATFKIYSGTATMASAVLTAVTPDPTAPATFLNAGERLLPLVSSQVAYPYYFGKFLVFDSDGLDPPDLVSVLSTTATTITISPPPALGGLVGSWIFTNSILHYGGSTATSTYAGIREEFEAVDYTLTSVSSLQGLADLAKSLQDKLKAHSLSGLTVSTLYPNIYYLGNFYDRYLDKGASLVPLASSAETWSAHASQAAGSTTVELGTWYPLSGKKQDRFDTAPQAASVNYTMVFANTYKVGNTEFVDRSKPALPINVITYESELSGGTSEQSLYAVNMANIYVYANAANENYDTAGGGFYKEIYRTPANESLFYLTTVDGLGGKITNATTSYIDITNEAFIASQLALYTNGGVVENDSAPVARFIHIVDNVAYYGYVTDGTDVFKNRVLQSLIGDPDSVPRDFSLDLDGSEVTGVSSYKSQVLAFDEAHVYRISGVYDLLGRGGMLRQTISQETGCVAPYSIVQTDIGVFFAGSSGFYYTDAYQVLKISDHLDVSFANATETSAQRNATRGVYDKYSRRVYFTIVSDSALTKPDEIWVLHLDFGVRKDMCFTKWSGGFLADNEYYPTAIMIYNQRPVVGTSGGYILDHDYSRYMDLKADTLTSPDTWVPRTLLWSIKTTDYDYGSAFMRKYATRVSAQFKQTTNLSVQINNDVDQGRLVGACTPIRSRKLSNWGDINIETPTGFVATAGGVVDEMRHFAAGTLRWNYMAVELKNAYVVVTNSDVIGNATVAGSTVTLNNPVKKWPLYVVGYDIELGGVLYPVVTRNSDTVITVTGAPTVGSQVWALKGYPKNELLRIINFNVSYDLVGLTQKPYGNQDTDSGDNG